MALIRTGGGASAAVVFDIFWQTNNDRVSFTDMTKAPKSIVFNSISNGSFAITFYDSSNQSLHSINVVAGTVYDIKALLNTYATTDHIFVAATGGATNHTATVTIEA